MDNTTSLQAHLDWLSAVLDYRMKVYFEQVPLEELGAVPVSPSLTEGLALDDFFLQEGMDWQEKLLVMLALAPHLNPQLLDIFFTKNTLFDRGFTEFGGLKAEAHSGFLPTIETAVFVIAGRDLKLRLSVIERLQGNASLFQKGILAAHFAKPEEPNASAQLQLNQELLHRILWGLEYSPNFGRDFPAKEITTALTWEDLVLDDFTLSEVLNIKHWIEHNTLIQDTWGLRKVLKPGFRSLFYGPPGTGKTLTASLLGKALNRPVYRIDLSMVVSKFIGETEKNLGKVFDMALHKDWILFFDEADALFSKRTNTNSSNDRYANQEVSYLLQRVEDYPGVVILATNLKGNIDDAFIRRFQSMIYFTKPDVKQRLTLWTKLFALGMKVSDELSLEELSVNYEITGGEMINVMRYLGIKLAQRKEQVVQMTDVIEGIRREFRKSGKVVTNS
ncbi:MAG: ATP-binding protein [Saprospiraceae bacterium]